MLKFLFVPQTIEICQLDKSLQNDSMKKENKKAIERK